MPPPLRGQSVTHVSGMDCYPCLGKGNRVVFGNLVLFLVQAAPQPSVSARACANPARGANHFNGVDLQTGWTGNRGTVEYLS